MLGPTGLKEVRKKLEVVLAVLDYSKWGGLLSHRVVTTARKFWRGKIATQARFYFNHYQTSL